MNEMRSFAQHGSEKMIYDIRMGPQGIWREGVFYIVYQANQESGKALPYITRYDSTSHRWSSPVVVGDVTHYDHHFAPVLWLDGRHHLHVLYHCHGTADGAVHRVSDKALGIDSWKNGPLVAPSISYPRVVHFGPDRLLLYYRALGHMGYWTYRISDDGGYSWSGPEMGLVDFDRDPVKPGDEWSGSYHSVLPGRDGQCLHMCFVYWDERKRIHPLYKQTVGSMNRYHLYYVRLELPSGNIYNAEGDKLKMPLNRLHAQDCLVWDSGEYLTNMPSIVERPGGDPGFLLPVSGEAIDDCSFYFIIQEGSQWARYRITEANSTWNGCHLEYANDGSLAAFLIARPPEFGDLPYGGGILQEWRSSDKGRTWSLLDEIVPCQGLLYNNPKPVEDVHGSFLQRTLLLFGWQGPDGILPGDQFRGHAYLWQRGTYL